MTKHQIENLKLSLRKIVATHSHVISRVRQDDERTMRIHLMSMLDTLEREITKAFPDIFAIKSWKTVSVVIKHLFKRQHRFCEDDYVNQVCYIMQAHMMQIRVVKQKYNDPALIAKEKGRISRDTSGKIFQLQG